jgi:hypothetical protein
MPAAQLRKLAAAFHARLFVVPHRPRPVGHGEGDTSQYAVDLVSSLCLALPDLLCVWAGILPSPTPGMLLQLCLL